MTCEGMENGKGPKWQKTNGEMTQGANGGGRGRLGVKNLLQCYKVAFSGVFEDFTCYKGCYNLLREVLPG